MSCHNKCFYGLACERRFSGTPDQALSIGIKQQLVLLTHAPGEACGQYYSGDAWRALRGRCFNGLGAAVKLAAINGGTHAAPSFAGDTIYAWSEVLEKMEIAGRSDVAALRLRTIAAKDHACTEFPFKDASSDGGRRYHPAVVLDLDYSVLIPRA